MDLVRKIIHIYEFKDNFTILEQLSSVKVPFEVAHLVELSPYRLGLIETGSDKLLMTPKLEYRINLIVGREEMSEMIQF